MRREKYQPADRDGNPGPTHDDGFYATCDAATPILCGVRA
jgi:hypothetical protein